MNKINLPPIKQEYVFLGLRTLVALLILFSGLSKLLVPREYFIYALGNYYLLPAWSIEVISFAFPWIETVFGVYILLGYWQKPSAFIILFNYAIAYLIIASALLRKLHVPKAGFLDGSAFSFGLQGSFFILTLIILSLLKLTDTRLQLPGFDRRFSSQTNPH